LQKEKTKIKTAKVCFPRVAAEYKMHDHQYGADIRK
jgi:hypothetical protein